MKPLLYSLTLFLTLFFNLQVKAQTANGAILEFAEKSFEFGDIVQGDSVKHVFKFINTGNAPLMLREVLTTCGCTVPKFSKDPVMPGKEGEILVKFNSEGKEGRLTKVITILSNATNNPARVNIVVNVQPKK
ncbi:MAG: DUF1573 domain-containing protein [Sporocytophaga sp.]|uniref:DUF1573 domain-containing protein n=1 Tax=Sporocytophaga sp. TaxID=2231183 RepID=UPI001B1BDD13|nr:DUF1573 domain-containing protein [Sporocytophaga sp.]MBO9700848.1 DUF1573 domain-containing protein [Sporocytophaga sp.]